MQRLQRNTPTLIYQRQGLRYLTGFTLVELLVVISITAG